jgi:alpha-amylase/alpha-mannosidase (GH57 family)
MTVHVAFLWHMHQPSYRDPIDDVFVLPWARLHALKDYLGMVEILRETPTVRVTFNLVPSLVDQIEAYAAGSAREGLLAVSLKPAGELTAEERQLALRGMFLAHRENLIGRQPRFAELYEKRGAQADPAALHEAAARFTTQDFRDLQVLSKLAWFDLGWQEGDPVVRGLVEKGRDFDERDKLALAERERALLGAILPAYRAAAERGQVELSTSPYYHPILPLLCDSAAHHEAHPGAPLPRTFRHPEEAAEQVRRALARHEAVFGRPPAGLWPPEGSVSEDAVLQMAKAGVRWTATDEGILERSVHRSIHRDSRGTAYPMEVLYRPWRRRTPAGDVTIVFRDRALSDLIGFSYSGMDPQRAARDLLERLRRVGERWQGQGQPGAPLVAVILDGENAWEYFRDGGRLFLRTLYRGLAEDPGLLRAVTVSEGIAAHEPEDLPRVFAGSWIRSDFSVWIGHADDRRAWDLLAEAREAILESEGRVEPQALEQAREIFRAACGSDWCWWYGEEHHSENDIEFDRLFRRHLMGIYRLLKREPPEALRQTLITARRLEVRQSQPSGRVLPVVDGRMSAPDEWVAAGVYRAEAGTAMHRSFPGVRTVRFGVGDEKLHVLVEGTTGAAEILAGGKLCVTFPGPTAFRYSVERHAGQTRLVRAEHTRMGWVPRPTAALGAAVDVLELSIPLSELRPDPRRTVPFHVSVEHGGVEVERHPELGPIELPLESVTRD